MFMELSKSLLYHRLSNDKHTQDFFIPVASYEPAGPYVITVVVQWYLVLYNLCITSISSFWLHQILLYQVIADSIISYSVISRSSSPFEHFFNINFSSMFNQYQSLINVFSISISHQCFLKDVLILGILGSHEKFTEYQFFLNVDSISIFDQCFLDINFSSMFSQKPK